jgi:hypothetical protein
MEEINTEVNKTNTFLSHMFSFDNDTKNELMNIGQYAILSIVPLVALVKLIDGLVANFDPTKGNIELVGEILVHLTLLIIAVFLVDRLVKYIPTYSGKSHKAINFLNIVIMFYLTTDKIGEKITELSSRVNDIWNGNLKPIEGIENKKDGNKVKVTQPIKQVQKPQPTHQASRADYLNAHEQMSATQNHQNEAMEQSSQQQNGASNDMYNSMGYQGPGNQMGMMEPMAANDALGGFTSF